MLLFSDLLILAYRTNWVPALYSGVSFLSVLHKFLPSFEVFCSVMVLVCLSLSAR